MLKRKKKKSKTKNARTVCTYQELTKNLDSTGQYNDNLNKRKKKSFFFLVIEIKNKNSKHQMGISDSLLKEPKKKKSRRKSAKTNEPTFSRKKSLVSTLVLLTLHSVTISQGKKKESIFQIQELGNRNKEYKMNRAGKCVFFFFKFLKEFKRVEGGS